MNPMMMTLQTILVPAPRSSSIRGAERVAVTATVAGRPQYGYAVHLNHAGSSYVWGRLELSGKILRGGKSYQIWYVTRNCAERKHNVIAEYVLEPGTDMVDFLIMVRNAVTQYIDGADAWSGKNSFLYSV